MSVAYLSDTDTESEADSVREEDTNDREEDTNHTAKGKRESRSGASDDGSDTGHPKISRRD